MARRTVAKIEAFYLKIYREKDIEKQFKESTRIFIDMMYINKKLELGFDETLLAYAAYIHNLFLVDSEKNHHILASDYVDQSKDSILLLLTRKERYQLSIAVRQHRSSYREKYSNELALLLNTSTNFNTTPKVIINKLYHTYPKRNLSNTIFDDTLEIFKHVKRKYSNLGYMRLNALVVRVHNKNTGSIYDSLMYYDVLDILNIKGYDLEIATFYNQCAKGFADNLIYNKLREVTCDSIARQLIVDYNRMCILYNYFSKSEKQLMFLAMVNVVYFDSLINDEIEDKTKLHELGKMLPMYGIDIKKINQLACDLIYGVPLDSSEKLYKAIKPFYKNPRRFNPIFVAEKIKMLYRKIKRWIKDD